MAHPNSIPRTATVSPARDAVRRCFLAVPRSARVVFSYFLSCNRDVPFADWDIAASTNPDAGVRLEVTRSQRRDSLTTLALVTELSRDELRALGHALVLLADQLGDESDAETWQEARV